MSNLTALGVHIYAGGFTVGVSKHFEPLGHLEEGKIGYGAPSAKLNFPHLPMISGVENWKPFIQDLRSRRGVPDLVYCNPPCFSPDTKVLTKSGYVEIKTLVDSKSTEEVLSYDEASQKMVYKKITGWHKNPWTGDVYDISLTNYAAGGRKLARARATANHSFLTQRGWVRADELTADDLICTGRVKPNELQHELIDGMMLGDSTIKKSQAQLVTTQISHEYVALKKNALSQFVCGEWKEDTGADWGGGYNRKPRSGFYLKTSGWVKRERARWYDSDGRKVVPRDVRLTALSLAVWYMDYGTKRSTSVVHLCTDNFAVADVQFLITKLAELGVKAELFMNKAYPRIKIGAEGIEAFYGLIAPYVSPDMRYKLPADAVPFNVNLWSLGEGVVDWDRVTITKLPEPQSLDVYCLDVEDTHNFLTYGGIAHNCAAFSIAGATMRGGGNAWRTDPRLSCWENCFSVLEELRPTMYVVESVVRAFTAGREFVDTFVERAAKMGYAATHTLVDAQYLGLPQVRKRYFLVLHKVGFELPAPNWAPPKTAAEALSEVSDPGYFEPIKDPIQKEMVPGLKQGQAMRPLWEKRMLEEVGPPETWPRSANGVKGRPRLFLHRIKGDKPIGTITGAYMIKHDEDRMLGMKELAYLNGYPEDYKFENHPRYHPSLIARGVSPTVASYLAAGLRQSIENGKPIKTGEVNLIDYREPPKGVVY